MKFGICGEPTIGALAAEAGYDFVELHVQRDLHTDQDENEFRTGLGRILASPLPCPAANCFLPGGHKVTGPQVDMDALNHYVTLACERAQRAGIDTIVFGSGGARAVPEGWDRTRANDQLIEFGRMLGPIAQQHGVIIVVEPLNRRECNIFNSVGECGRYVEQVNHPHIRLLVDAYHWAVENDSAQDLVRYAPLICHAHIATYRNRLAPGLEACDFVPFFRALKQGGYDGRLSIEGRWPDMVKQAEPALKVLQQSAAQAGF